jgi:multidrug efflux pump subunit AcrB
VNITRLAIDNNRLTLVVLLVIVASGVQTFIAMPRAYDPGFIIRAAQVVTYFPGASPERVEQLVSSRLEEEIKEIPELDFVASESRTGISIVTVNIKERYKQMRPIWDNLRRKVEGVEGELPEDVIGPFVNDEFGDVYGIVFTITGEGFSYAELNAIAEDVRDQLQRLPDAAKVDILGEQEERIFIEYDNSRLSELNISPYQLSQYLETRNIVLSGGSFTLGSERISLEPSGNFESIEDIKQTILKLPGSDRLIYLKDLARVRHGYVDPPDALVHSSGVRALALAVAMREGGNNIELGEQVQRALVGFNHQYPYGIEFNVINYAPREVDQKVKSFVASLLQAVLIVTLVMLLTLKLRTGLIVSSLIPLSMLLSLIVMSFFNIGLDQISLAALIIALGMLVDNGIVMSENIMVQMEKGKSAPQAALDSAAELRIPLLTASLTTAAAFLPIFLAESNVGEFTASLFKVVTITLLCSWVISLTVIPMFCVYLLKVTSKQESFSGRFYTLYRRLLTKLLDHRLPTLVSITILGVIIVVGGFQYLPKVFFPPSDRSYFKVELELPAGTDIAATRGVVVELEAFMERELAQNGKRKNGVTNWISYIGNAGPKFILSHNPKPSNPGYALLIVNVSNVRQIADYMTEIRRYALDHFPDLDIKTRLIEEGPAVENPVEIRLSGSDSALLFKAVEEVKQQMHAIGGLTSVSDNWGQRIKKLLIRIDQARALRVGVTSQDIAVSLQAGLGGMSLTEYRQGEDVIPVELRSLAANQQDISKLEALAVYVQSTGKSIPLKQVADIELVWDRAKILRRNGQRTVSVGAQLENNITASEKFAQLLPWLEQRESDWRNAVRYELGGESESSEKANQSIADKLPIAGFIIMILLVAQFNSLRKALIILLTIPMGLIGVIPGLLLANSFFGFMTLLGIISLAGIVINNAIVLLERIQIERDNGLEHLQAIISAAAQRARPILLTTATTVLGLIPLYLGGGEMWEPMAVTIMAGLLFSTVLTLGVVPVLYAVLFRVGKSQSESIPSL